MGKLVKVHKVRPALALLLASAATALLAGCSSDTSVFSNPFQDSARIGGTDRTATGSIVPPEPIGSMPAASGTYAAAPYAAAPAAPVSSVTSTPLAPVRGATAGPYASAYAPPPKPMSRIEPLDKPITSGASFRTAHGVWSADGGTRVLVHSGENAAILAERYSVPVEAIVKTNGFVSAAQIHAGSRIVIPVYSADGAAGRGPERVGRLERPAGARYGQEHVARNEPLPPRRPIYHFVKGPSGAPDGHHETADRKDRDRTERSARRTEQEDKSAQLAQTKHESEKKVAEIAPTRVPSRVDKSSTASLPPAGAETAAARPGFRWPAHGRIIAGFKPGVNDGINIAVPDGTNVKAVDDGVVAYAGNELKGYGNLVLIRHSNGYVSAYADNGQILVHRGETVRRGQVIAKSGQSGNVSSPQLHFELRKGQTPVDPTRFLGGA